MRCAEARRQLFDPLGRARSPQLADHLDRCVACAALAERLRHTQQQIRAYRSEHTPDPGFAARVIARLPDATAVLGWAALRLLPAALALALLCSWYSVTRGPGASDLLLRADDPQLLTYVALGGEALDAASDPRSEAPSAREEER